MYRRGDVNAEESAALNERLTRANDAMIGRLVERALAGTCLACEHGAEEADREVLEGLCLGAAPDPAATAPARIQTLATAVGQTVDDAIGEHDPKSLSHLYHRLFVSGGSAPPLIRCSDVVGWSFWQEGQSMGEGGRDSSADLGGCGEESQGVSARRGSRRRWSAEEKGGWCTRASVLGSS